MEGQHSVVSAANEHENMETRITVRLEGVVVPEESAFPNKSIYKAPQYFVQPHSNTYDPHVVSIGPLYNVDSEQLKPRYFKAFLSRTELSMAYFTRKIAEWEADIRSYYGDTVRCNSGDFINLVLIDACFIVELFLRFSELADGNWAKKDPIFSRETLKDDVSLDLVLAQNQLPYFVLEALYNIVAKNRTDSFLQITFKFFGKMNLQNLEAADGLRPLHFTHLLWIFLVPSSDDHQNTERILGVVENLHSVTELQRAGLNFKLNENKGFADMKFAEGVLAMPRIEVHSSTEKLYSNILVFEHRHFSNSPVLAEFFWILHFLIKTEADVNALVDKNIIVNLTGNPRVVVDLFGSLSGNLSVPNMKPGYFTLCNDLNGFHEKPLHKFRAALIREFSSKWKRTCVIVAIVVGSINLALSIISNLKF